jgi:hypothetical protein
MDLKDDGGAFLVSHVRVMIQKTIVKIIVHVVLKMAMKMIKNVSMTKTIIITNTMMILSSPTEEISVDGS